MILHLFDMSNFIYSGLPIKETVNRGVREVDGYWEANSMPIGPLIYFFNFIKGTDFTKNQVIPIFDRTPEIKRALYTDTLGEEQSYKGTRTRRNKHITLYSKMLEWALRECGFACQAVDGYEADDIIHTTVNLMKGKYEKIYIYTLDSDLSYLVSDNVEIKKPNSLGKNISIDNYAYTVRKDRTTEYNTVHIYKLCEGDKSDNIPGIGVNWIPIFGKYLPRELYPTFGNLDILRKLLMKVVQLNPTEPNAHLVLPIFKLITPLMVPEEELNFEQNPIDYEKIFYFKSGMKKSDDLWDFEDTVLSFIDKYHEEEIDGEVTSTSTSEKHIDTSFNADSWSEGFNDMNQ